MESKSKQPKDSQAVQCTFTEHAIICRGFIVESPVITKRRNRLIERQEQKQVPKP